MKAAAVDRLAVYVKYQSASIDDRLFPALQQRMELSGYRKRTLFAASQRDPIASAGDYRFWASGEAAAALTGPLNNGAMTVVGGA